MWVVVVSLKGFNKSIVVYNLYGKRNKIILKWREEEGRGEDSKKRG